jgi:hypothetical protein
MLNPGPPKYEAGSANHSTVTSGDITQFKSETHVTESFTLHYRLVRHISYDRCRM